MIRSAIIDEGIDSVKFLEMSRMQFSDWVGKRAGIKKGHSAKLYKMLLEELPKTSILKWSNVVTAVSHEMGKLIANKVSTLTVNMKCVAECTVEILMPRITFEAKKSLTTAEALYLRALLKRAIHYNEKSSQNITNGSPLFPFLDLCFVEDNLNLNF